MVRLSRNSDMLRYIHSCRLYPHLTTPLRRLQNKIIDLEVANCTPSPTIDPSVHTILIGHSMGGIVAAETLLSIVADQQPIHENSMHTSSSHSQSKSPTSSTFASSTTSSLPTEPGLLMFPYIQGILAFDTPYLGIAPGVVAHGAEKHWQTASSAYSAYTNLASAFGWGGSGAKSPPSQATNEATRKMLTAPESSASADAAAAPLWQRYGRVALFAGAAGAVAAGGAAAYMKREQITEGWSWATSHLEFVGSLARPEDMRRRLSGVVHLAQTLEIGFENVYTALGHAVDAANEREKGKDGWAAARRVPGRERTFCNLPKGEELSGYWWCAVNDKVGSETLAHMSMFEPRGNPGYYGMSERAKEDVVGWVEETRWYRESEGGAKERSMGGMEEDEGEGEMVERDEEEDYDMDEELGGDEDFEKVGRGKRDEL